MPFSAVHKPKAASAIKLSTTQAALPSATPGKGDAHCSSAGSSGSVFPAAGGTVQASVPLHLGTQNQVKVVVLILSDFHVSVQAHQSQEGQKQHATPVPPCSMCSMLSMCGG
jgi:hypothetical protein